MIMHFNAHPTLAAVKRPWWSEHLTRLAITQLVMFLFTVNLDFDFRAAVLINFEVLELVEIVVPLKA